jgi:hypothetical protein
MIIPRRRIVLLDVRRLSFRARRRAMNEGALASTAAIL